MYLAKLATNAMESFSHKANARFWRRLHQAQNGHSVSHYICRPVSPNFSAASKRDLNTPAVAIGDILLCLCHCLMSRPPRPEPVAVIGKRPVPTPL